MFSVFKRKLNDVQGTINSSLNSLKATRNRQESNAREKDAPGIDFDAGKEIAAHYETQWNLIRKQRKMAAAMAAEADRMIQVMAQDFKSQNNKNYALNKILASLPRVTHDVHEISDSLLRLQCSFEETEEALMELEDAIEAQELQQKATDHQIQLILYHDKRMQDISAYKEKLKNNHMRKIAEYEIEHEKELKERQEVFQQAFHSDMKTYEKYGINALRKGHKSSKEDVVHSRTYEADDPTPSLESVELPCGNMDELESFLRDCDEDTLNEAITTGEDAMSAK